MIKMICGVYGGVDGMKRPEDGAFSLPPDEEARLVRRGVAVYTNELAPGPGWMPVDPETESIDNIPDCTGDPIGFDEMPPDEMETVEEVDLTTLSAKELRDLGAEYGLTFKGNASRAYMIEQIMAAQEEMDTEETGESPEFDPAEAVV